MIDNDRKKQLAASLLRFMTYIAVYLGIVFLEIVFISRKKPVLFGMMALHPDAALYLSIADNFLATGHFIQTARPTELGFVVPFGVPAILTLFRALGLSVVVIQVFHCILLGISCLLLRETERVMRPESRVSVAPWLFIAGVLFEKIYPGVIYVEHYYLVCLCALLRLLSAQDMAPARRLGWMNVFGFMAFVIRPVLSVVWLAVLGYTVYAALRRRIRPWLVLWAVLIPGLVLGINLYVNYRETGQLILLECYSGRDMYIALNPGAVSGMMPVGKDILNTVGDIYEETVTGGLPVWEQSRILKSAALEFVRNQPLRALRLVTARFVKMFIVYLLGLPLFAWEEAWVTAKEHPELKWQIFAQVRVALLLSVITAFGNFVSRYTVVIFPVLALHLSGPAELVLSRHFPRWFPPENK